MATGLNRQCGTIIDASQVQYHKYLLTTVANGSTITRIRCRMKQMFSPSLNISDYTIQAYWSHSIGWVANGASPPPFPSASPTDDSILAFDLFEPEALERIFWAPGNGSFNEAGSAAVGLEFRGQWRLTEAIDLYYLIDDNAQAAGDSYHSVAWQVWFH